MMLFLRDLMDRYDQLSLRERVLVLAAVVGIVMLLWENVLMAPLDRERKQRRGQVEALRAEVQGLEQSVEAIVAQGSGDPDRRSRAAIDTLQKQIAALDVQLAGATSGLIAPKEMARVLEQLLARTSRLTLQGLRTLPIESLLTSPTDASGEPGMQIYRHGIELQVSGTYLETLQFLQAVEALPWRFFWERVEFQVDDHPQGRLKLTLYTLGLQQGWIGV